MNKDKHTNISLTEAAWLAARLGLRFGPLSPLKRAAGATGTDSDRRSLADKGLVDSTGNPLPETVACMTNAADPGAELVLDIGDASLLHVMRVVFGKSGAASACTPFDETQIRISPVMELEDILVTLLEGLGIAPSMGENPFACDLSTKGLLALSALVDATRQSHLRCLLNRNDNIETVVDFIDVWACLQRGLVEDSFRWLTAVIRSRLPDEMTVNQHVLSEGLDELIAAGLAAREGNAWAIAEDRVEFLTELMTPLRFGSLFARANADNNAVRLLLIRCPSSLWAIHFPVGGGKAALFTLSADRLGTIVAEIMAHLIALGRQAGTSRPPASPPSVTPPPSQSARYCASCGTAVTEGARFCAGCGKPVPAPETKPSCPACSKPVRPDQKFCASCGHRLA